MLSDVKKFTRVFAVAVLLTGVTTAQAAVGPTNAKWKNECGACHVAFPTRMLHAESWRAIMAGLDKHFGSNASLDDETASEITDFLVKNARTKGSPPAGKPLLRITETPWFKSEHREVADRNWKNPKVKSPANCSACHPQADIGDFNEDNVKIPK